MQHTSGQAGEGTEVTVSGTSNGVVMGREWKR